MMAKMFYTLDEAKAALGKDEDEIKQYAREGKLREFRDGSKLMYKTDQVEMLKKELGIAGGGTDLEDGGNAIPLEAGGSGSGMDLDLGREDNLSNELGLSGSLGGIPSPRGSGGSVAGSKAGINIFGDDDSVSGVDPRAQTNVGAGAREQINLEGVGSGSGLLDLSRDNDDTSLGAELLDEIGPGASRKGGTSAGTMGDVDVSSASSGSAVLVNVEPPKPISSRNMVPLQIEAPDPLAPAFAAASLAAALVSLFALLALFSGSAGARPDMVKYFADKTPLILLGIGLGLTALSFIVGLFLGKLVR